MNWPGSCGRIETPCRTRQGAQEVPDIMLSFYLSALESAADKEDFRALYRRYQRTYHDKRMEYSETYGPLSHMEPITAAEYNWLNDPWPWEYCANKEG